VNCANVVGKANTMNISVHIARVGMTLTIATRKQQMVHSEERP
jgi:hypothetical protein